MSRSKLLMLVIAIAIVAYPLYYYKNKSLEEKRVLAKLESKQVIDARANIVTDEKEAVPTIELALQIAEPILKNECGNEVVESAKPFSVSLVGNVWVIRGTESQAEGRPIYAKIDKQTGAIVGISRKK